MSTDKSAIERLAGRPVSFGVTDFKAATSMSGLEFLQAMMSGKFPAPPICEVLDRVQTRLYENAVIPLALAHSAASLPLGVGQSVLRALGQRLLGLHRRHLGAKMRAAGREVSLHRGALPEATSAALAARLLGRVTRPSEAAIRAEVKVRLQEVLNRMEPLDREVLSLRHFEQLTTAEAARELEISEEATRKRHVRALRRLREFLTDTPGGPEEYAR